MAHIFCFEPVVIIFSTQYLKNLTKRDEISNNLIESIFSKSYFISSLFCNIASSFEVISFKLPIKFLNLSYISFLSSFSSTSVT